jgi:hypothetical protein
MNRKKGTIRKARRAPFSVALVEGPLPSIEFTELQWDRISGNFCCPITAEDKAAIGEAIRIYLLFQQGERAAEFIEDAAPHVKNIRKGAEQLFTALLRPEAMPFSFAHQAAVDDVLQSLQKYMQAYYHRPFEVTHDQAVSIAGFLLNACEEAMGNLRDKAGIGLQVHTS